MRKLLADTQYHNIFNSFMLKNVEALKANKDISETSLHQTFIVNAAAQGYTFASDDDYPERIIKTFFSSVAVYLGKKKVSKEDEATALVLQDISGNFKFMACVEYHLNETNPEEPGNWSLMFSFNEDDLHELEKIKAVKIYLFGDEAFKSIMDKVSRDIGGFEYGRETFMYDSCLIVVDTLLQVMDFEAKAGEVVDIEFPAFFTISVAVENGEKVISITPDSYLKGFVKEDIKLDK